MSRRCKTGTLYINKHSQRQKKSSDRHHGFCPLLLYSGTTRFLLSSFKTNNYNFCYKNILQLWFADAVRIFSRNKTLSELIGYCQYVALSRFDIRIQGTWWPRYKELTRTITDVSGPMWLCMRSYHQADVPPPHPPSQDQMTTGNNRMGQETGFIKHLYLCKRTSAGQKCRQMWVLISFFPLCENNLLPYLSVILLSSGVYSGKPG